MATRVPTRTSAFCLATSLSLLVAGCGSKPTLGAAFEPQGNCCWYSPGPIRLGEPVWLGIPPKHMVLGTPVHVTSATLLPSTPGLTRQSACVSSLKADQHQFLTAASATDFADNPRWPRPIPAGRFAFTRGDSDHYLQVRAEFSRPGYYVFNDVVLKYQSGDRVGVETIHQEFRVLVLALGQHFSRAMIERLNTVKATHLTG